MFFVISTNNQFPSQISAIISEKLSFLFGTPYLKKFSLWHRCQIKLINILIPHLDVSIILIFFMFIICFLVPNLFKKLLEVVKRSRQSADLCLLITKHIYRVQDWFPPLPKPTYFVLHFQAFQRVETIKAYCSVFTCWSGKGSLIQ